MDNTKGIGNRPQTPPSVPSTRDGKNYVLAIGIDDYTHHRPLKNAVADATAFGEVMTTRYGFQHLHEPLFNTAATKRNIVKALGKCESLTEHDRLIVFYSGHGWYKTAAKLGYLVPTEAEDDPNYDFIEVTSILNIFRGVKANHILLVVDCCFGGSFGLERNVQVSVTEAMTEKKITQLDIKKSRMVLSSGGIELVSDGLVAENNSPFTKPLVTILRENKAPQMAFSEFFNLLQKQTLWNAEQIPQYKVLPNLGHADGELALSCTDLETPEARAFRKAMENPSVAVLAKFIKDFPQSEHKATIRSLLKEKRAEEAWAKIKNSRFIEVFDEFIENHRDSPLAELAQQKIDALDIGDEQIEKEKQLASEKAQKQREQQAEEQLWQDCKTKRTPSVYLSKFPNGEFKSEALRLKARIEEEEKRRLLEPEMVFVKGGTFDRENQKVTLSDFSIGKYPVTQKQWETIMGDNPSRFKGETLPVEMVSWDDCQAFIQKLNEKTGKKYRLPTEAEWEFAARGGNQTNGFEYSGSKNLDEVGWYWENSGDKKLSGSWDWDIIQKNNGKTHPVGSKKANELGIHDMSGNVWEWCNDWYGDYTGTVVTNPKGADTGSYRVHRGGSWALNAEFCRSSNRLYDAPTNRFNYLGFRLVSSLQ